MIIIPLPEILVIKVKKLFSPNWTGQGISHTTSLEEREHKMTYFLQNFFNNILFSDEKEGGKQK